MNLRIVGLLTAVTATLTAPVIAHAEHATPVAARAAACKFSFEPPRPFVHAGAVIVGGYVTCNPTPQDFHILFQLQFKEGDTWITRGGADSDEIPNPNLNIAARDLDCDPGQWQGAYTMSWTGGGDWTVVNNVSDFAPITC